MTSKHLINKIKNWLLFFQLKAIKNFKKLTYKSLTEKDIQELQQELSIEASWNSNYIACTISSCLIATFGLISNSTAVIIGAMLIAPLMLPLRALAFASLEGDFPLFKKAILSLIGSTILALFLSYFMGKIIGIPEYGSELLARTQPNLIDLGIALSAGGISAFAKIRKGISDALAGTAIAVALMPPLCVVGLSLSQKILAFSQGAFLLYLTNLLGITLACMIIFICAGYTQINHALGWTLGLTGILLLPLGFSFWQLITQSQLQQTLRETLLNKTITLGQRPINLVNIKMNWNMSPPLATLTVQTQEEITPKQVQLVQDFIYKQMGQPFKLKFVVTQINVIESD